MKRVSHQREPQTDYNRLQTIEKRNTEPNGGIDERQPNCCEPQV